MIALLWDGDTVKEDSVTFINLIANNDKSWELGNMRLHSIAKSLLTDGGTWKYWVNWTQSDYDVKYADNSANNGLNTCIFEFAY